MKTTSSFSKGLFAKGAFIALAALCMQIPVLLIKTVINDRIDCSLGTEAKVSSSWGGNQTISAPELLIPHLKEIKDDKGNKLHSEEALRHYSYDVAMDGDVSVEMLHKSIYDIPVYRTGLEIGGNFKLSENDIRLACGDCRLILPLDMRNGIEEICISINGKPMPVDVSQGEIGCVIPRDELKPGMMQYDVKLKTRGTRSLMFRPKSETLSVHLKSDFPSPGFVGACLPCKRNVTAEGFEAEWRVTSLNLSYGYDKTFGVELIVPVSQYQQTMRSVKYSFLIILLVFMAIYLVESISRKNVSIVQYIVTGFSLCLFYLILLSLTEYISFSMAYLTASVMTTAALGCYFSAILRSWSAWLFAGAVAGLYGFIYILLQLETASLLVGTAALFVLLCTVMYFTRNAGDDGKYTTGNQPQ